MQSERTPTLLCGREAIKYETQINSQKDLEALLRTIDNLKLCPGPDEEYKRPQQCLITMPVDSVAERCLVCRSVRKVAARKKIREEQRQEKERLAKSKKEALQKERMRLKKKVMTLTHELHSLQERCKKVKVEVLEESIKMFPEKMQEAVRACYSAATAKGPHGTRYSKEWMYECILLRIKGPALYRSMRDKKILPLPSRRHILRYLEKIRPAYGFNPATFELLKKKGQHMSTAEKHGAILLDEMSLTKSKTFNKSTLEIDGFVDLGDHTPENQRYQEGDHGLVIMFQPFRGKSFQTLGAFLSRGAAKSSILEKLILEAILLVESAGFFVDEVVTDGATWNRSMWTLFGVNSKNVSSQHPSDEKRRLWFTSDFPHLIKTVKARILKNLVLHTPDGVVKLDHWKIVIEEDEKRGIKRAFKLTLDHLKPKNYQSMNVKMAFTFFSNNVATAMESYKRSGLKGLEDCQPTIDFIKRVDKLIDAMNSQVPRDALSPNPQSKHYKAITNFIEYIEKWEREQPDRKKKLTREAQLGFLVSLKGALELVEYLNKKVGYSYLMTRRINQDALEHFFGSIREACGVGQHPDSLLFIQVYRLLSVYSLIKPPRGSNVTGGEMLTSMISLEDIVKEENRIKKAELEEKLDAILDSGNYDFVVLQNVDQVALTCFGGYVARRAQYCSVAKQCHLCLQSLQDELGEISEENTSLIDLRTRGYLITPSFNLLQILNVCEAAVIKVTGTSSENLKRHTLFEVMDETAKMGLTHRLGCPEHEDIMTKWAVNFYIQTRMIFACREANKKLEEKKAAKRLQKLSRVVQSTSAQRKSRKTNKRK